ncbi:nitrate ABC transporter ATPase [uncultured archaeon]|nr:nitrate ABC transporter ATPase [uncultured archaeon]
MDQFLTLENIHMEYKYRKTSIVSIEDISFSINRNEFVSIIGPSGCGKSTIVKMILGLISPTSGKVLMDGDDLRKGEGRVSVVFQSAALFPWLDVLQNVEIVLEPLIRDKEERIRVAMKYIKMVGIDGFENAYPRELSGGMKQRVAIARALSTSPDLLVLDEPFVGLDVFAAQAMREELLDLWDDQNLPPHTVLMVTHNVDEAVQMSDRIIILSKRPSHIIQAKQITLPRPRNTRSDEFYRTVDDVLKIMSG